MSEAELRLPWSRKDLAIIGLVRDHQDALAMRQPPPDDRRSPEA
jgi:hypothetical protein